MINEPEEVSRKIEDNTKDIKNTKKLIRLLKKKKKLILNQIQIHIQIQKILKMIEKCLKINLYINNEFLEIFKTNNNIKKDEVNIVSINPEGNCFIVQFPIIFQAGRISYEYKEYNI